MILAPFIFLGKYIKNLALGVLDQSLNTILFGYPDETISSRLGRTIGNERYWWVKPFRIFVDTLFFFDYEMTLDDSGNFTELRKVRHCEKSVMPLEQMHLKAKMDELWSWVKPKGESRWRYFLI